MNICYRPISSSKSILFIAQKNFLSTMIHQKVSLFQILYWRYAIQSPQLSLLLSFITIYLAAQQYSCVTRYNCTTSRVPPRESLCLCLPPLTLCFGSVLYSFLKQKGYFCFLSSGNVFCSYILNCLALYRTYWRMFP